MNYHLVQRYLNMMRSNPNLSKDQLKAVLTHLLEEHFGSAFAKIPAEQKEAALDKYVNELTPDGVFPRDALTPQKMLELATGFTTRLVLENNPLTFTADEKAFIEEQKKPENTNKPLTPEEQKLADSITKKLDNLGATITTALLQNDMLKISPSPTPSPQSSQSPSTNDDDEEDEEAIHGINFVVDQHEKETIENMKTVVLPIQENISEEKPEPSSSAPKKQKPLSERLAGIDTEEPNATPVHIYLGNFFNSIDFNPNHEKNLSKVPSQDRMEKIVLANPQQGIVTNYEKFIQDKEGGNVEENLIKAGVISSRYAPTLTPGR